MTTRLKTYNTYTKEFKLDAIRTALLEASSNEKGKIMLRAINTTSFEQASNAVYDGYAVLLADVWGYE